jgi:hypothetical protein
MNCAPASDSTVRLSNALITLILYYNIKIHGAFKLLFFALYAELPLAPHLKYSLGA